MLEIEPIGNSNFIQILNKYPKNESKLAISLLSRDKPFWSEDWDHSLDEIFKFNDKVVTGSGIGEAAFQRFLGKDSSLVSITPSNWDFSPVVVNWIRTNATDRKICLDNWRTPSKLEEKLRTMISPLNNWHELSRYSKERFKYLIFGKDCFNGLVGIPFKSSSALRIQKMFEILNEFATCFDSNGNRTAKGHEIYQNYFTKGVLFSDSSDTEKKKFRKELTFPHPVKAGEKLFCPWHGKEQHLTLRMHFEWSNVKNKIIYIVYVGNKLTKT